MKNCLSVAILCTFFTSNHLDAQGPGGVSTSLKLWNKANTGVTTSGSNVTAWTDQTATNTFTVTGTPVLQSAALNYNPTILFDGASRFTGNTAVTGITHAFAVGKIVNSAPTAVSGALIGNITNVGYQYFFHTEGGRLYCSGNLASVFTSFTSANTIPYSLLSEDLSQTPAASDKIRLNGVAQTNATGGDPAVFNATPTLGSRTTENLLNGSELAEAIVYTNSQSTTNVSKIESYLALKYGITISNNYLNAAAATIYDVSSYNSDIIGIARDDNSVLTQKQSHQLDDNTRIYLSTLAASNTANTGTFSTDGQAVVMGNNATTLANNTANTEYPSGLSIISRINREWKITNTAFTGTFSLDITPSSGTFTAANIRVLIDDDGDFTNAVMVAPAIAYSGGVITVSGISTAMIPANSTKYLAIAVAATPGGVGSNMYLWTKADAGVVATGSNVSQWTNQAPVTMTTQASKTASTHVTLNSNDFNYNPTLVFDGTSNEVLAGTFASASTNPAMLFAVVKKTISPNNFLGNAYSLGAAGAAGVGYTGSGSSANFAIDRAGGTCSVTGDVMNMPGIVRADYGSAATVSGAVTAFNGLVSTADCSSGALGAVDGTFQIGGRTFSGQSARVFAGEIAEVIHYNTDNLPNAATDINKVESYLAVKYGITLNNSGGGVAGDYLSSPGVTVWDASDGSGYHNNIIGIGRDDNSTLYQKQSHQLNDSTRIYISTLASSNQANAGTFSSDGQFVLMGNNTAALASQGSTEFPTGLGIYRRIEREWKITNSSFSGTFSLDVKLNTTPITASDLRILIDDDGNFTNATLYNPSISYTGGVVTVPGISTAMIPANSTKYLTIVSMNATTTLPVALLNFTATAVNNKYVQLNWQTASEINNAYFLIQRSANGVQWEDLAKIPGAGNADQLLSYAYIDNTAPDGLSYYRLQQTDLDGKTLLSDTKSITINPSSKNKLNVYPNPASSQVTVEGEKDEIAIIDIYDAAGRNITPLVKITSISKTKAVINIANLASGIYVVKTKTQSGTIKKD